MTRSKLSKGVMKKIISMDKELYNAESHNEETSMTSQETKRSFTMTVWGKTTGVEVGKWWLEINE